MAHTMALTRLSLLAIALACSYPAGAAGIGFEEALAMAQARAPALTATRFQLEAARQEESRAGALPDPRLVAGMDNLPVTGNQAFVLGAEDMTMTRLGLRQMFPAPAQRRAQRTLAGRQRELAQATQAAEQAGLRQRVATAWLALHAAEQERESLRALHGPAALALSLAQTRLRAGAGTALDALSAQNARLVLDNRLSEAESRVAAARAELARWVEGDADSLATDGKPPAVGSLDHDEGALLASLDALASQQPWSVRESVAAAEVELATAQRRPGWELGASYGRRAGGRDDMISLEVAIDLPVFAASRQDRGIAARRAELAAVSAQREDARREQAVSLRQSLAQWRALEEQVDRIDRQMLVLAGQREDVALAAYRAGADLQPRLDAREDGIDLRVERARLWGELGRAWASLNFLWLATGDTP